MLTLRNIFDNVTHSSDKWEPYFEIYERHLNQFIGKEVTLVEIGVQKGGSLEMWSNYLGKKANIIGIDIDPNCTNLRYDQNNIKVVIGNQESSEFWDKFISENGKIDILIDDGGHSMEQQKVTFEKVFPVIQDGGVFICEDCHSSYEVENGLLKPHTFIEYAKSYIDVLHYDWNNTYVTELDRRKKLSEGLTSIHAYDSVIVFEKLGKRKMHRVFPKL